MTRDDATRDFLERSDRLVYRSGRLAAVLHAGLPAVIGVGGLFFIPFSGAVTLPLAVGLNAVDRSGSIWLVLGWCLMFAALTYFGWAAAQRGDFDRFAVKARFDQAAARAFDAVFASSPDVLDGQEKADRSVADPWLSEAQSTVRRRLAERMPADLLSAYLRASEAALSVHLGLHSEVGQR